MTNDGLEPPGEQLELFPDPLVETVTVVHRPTWNAYGWTCPCGAGRDWPSPSRRPRASAIRHLRAVKKHASGP